MTAPRDMESICVTLESLLRLANSEVQEMRNSADVMADIRNSARAVLALRKADDVAFRAAVTVLVTDILGAGCWDSSNNEADARP